MSEMQDLKEQVSALADKVNEIHVSVESIRSVTERVDLVRTAEAAALFDKQAAYDDRLRVVERDYATKQDVANSNARILEVEKQVWRMAGVVALIQFIGLAGIAALLKFAS